MSFLRICRKTLAHSDLCNFVKLKPSTIRVACLLKNGHDSAQLKQLQCVSVRLTLTEGVLHVKQIGL